MDQLLAALRACAEPTRLRILALAARGSFCVMEFTEILGQSQPRLSRHLRLLGEAGLLEREREGANVWFALPPPETPGGSLARAVLERLPEDDATLAADRRQAARVLAERAREASESFRRTGRRLGRDARARPAGRRGRGRRCWRCCREPGIGRLLDIGTGTGRLLEVLAPRVTAGLGIDASRAMLALARARLARPGLTHCAVRLADMYRAAAGRCRLRPGGAADGAALRRGPGRRAGRGGARAARRAGGWWWSTWRRMPAPM